MISILASIGMDIPVIISERGDPKANNGWFTRLRDFIYYFADGYVFQTSGAKQYFCNSIQKRSIVIKNPVVNEKIPEWSRERQKNIIVNVARYELKQKRQDILIEAFAEIASKFPKVDLVLYGSGEDELRIKNVALSFGLTNRVILSGLTTKVYEKIKEAKLFVLSSDYEGIPNALIEAMSVGVPCISTDCSPGGAAELITNRTNGLLVEAGNVEALAQAMEYMLKNPDEAERMGNNAKSIVNELSPNKIIRDWEGELK